VAAGSRPTSAPRGGGAARPRRSVAKRVALVLGGLVVVGGALGVAGFAYGYASTDVPEPTELGQKATTTVFYSDGTTPLGQFADVNRTPVETAAIPEVMRQAVIAAEDRSFYENRGVSPSSIARAFVSNLRGNATQGGSTITQQYVKNYYTGDDTQSLERKVREAFIALKVDQQLDKEQILTDYLNTIYFGRGAYGVQEAAQAYFGVDVEQLDASQAALLAGVVPAPSAYDPAVDPAAAERRWEYVVGGMVETGALTQAERDALVLPETVQQEADEVYAGPDGYLLQAVRDELTTRGAFTADELDGGGLTITTTFDVAMQEDAVAAMEDEDAFPVEDRPEGVLGSLVSVDPADGAVKALYGGADYLQRQVNGATQDRMQAGSTFKPFALVAGLEEGISLRTRFNGNNGASFENGYSPGNFGGESYGRQNLVEATVTSTNSVYVGLNEEVGPEATADAAVRAGLPETTTDLFPAYLSNVLGTASPTVLDMAHAYSTFAAQGVRTTPHVVAEVRQDDEVVYPGGPPASERVFDEDVMADTTYALEQVVEDGSVSSTIDLDRPTAGKTGTSNEAKSAWFVGYVPQLATAVAIYSTDGEGMDRWDSGNRGRAVTGSSYPAAIWQEYMEAATDGMEVLDFPERADVGSTSGRSSSSDDDDEDDDEPQEERTVLPPAPEPTASTPAPTPSEEPTEEPTQEPEPSTAAPAPSPTATPEDDAEEPAEPTGPAEPARPTEPGDRGEDRGDGPGAGTDPGDEEPDTAPAPAAAREPDGAPIG
jgi:membrane peptidoglycan carboxypeptidase